MSVLRARLFLQKISANACRTFSTEKSETPKYWHAISGKTPRSFDEMPTVEETDFNPYKSHEIFPRWFEKYGYIVRQPVGAGTYIVHAFHFDDFDTVHKGDAIYRRATKGKGVPQRPSHLVLKHLRENYPELYDNIGLGPGDGEFVGRIRDLMRESMSAPINWKLEKVADDLINIIRAKVGEGGEIELLPWLFRWGFENTGMKFLDKRLGALSEKGNEEADKMVEAAAVTNEMVFLTTIDPITDYDERYRKVEAAQNYFYGVLKKYIDEVASQPHSNCVVKNILKKEPKDAITVTLDGFQGALQTVPLTALMAFYNLARNKDIQAKAREELREDFPYGDLTYRSLEIQPPEIIANIVWETLRISPPIIGSGRVIKNDMVLGGYNVPKETNVILHFQVASKLKEFYDDPLKFNPYRFKTANPDRVKKVFGTGSWRACFGARFATETLSLIIAKMLLSFELSYDGGDITMINRLHNEPEEPLFLKLKPWSPWTTDI